MSEKSILLVTSAFYPEISPRSFRATELAREFSRAGHKVVVLSRYRDFDYKIFLGECSVSLKMWKKSRYPVVPNFKSPVLSLIGRLLTRVLSLLFEYPDIAETPAIKESLKTMSGFDLMISFAVPFPVHWAVAGVQSGGHPVANVWIADCGDPYMFARLDNYRKPFYFKFAEKHFCRSCDFITVPFMEMRDQFYPEFKSKIRVIPQGFNFDEVNLCKDREVTDKPVFIFAGSIIPGKRDLKLFLDFLCTLPRDFLFIVYTNQASWFDPYKSCLGKKLEIREYIDRLSLITIMSTVDFLVNVDTVLDNQSNREAVPSKLIDYALSGRPILNLSSAVLDESLVLDFLNQDYSRQRFVDISRHNIRDVAARFLSLADKNESSIN
ncbi:MAG: hypothetical protein GT600_16965 [Bacteroidales bacterium]|nr:hypothetical protein [Bacteroidales bacterium]